MRQNAEDADDASEDDRPWVEILRESLDMADDVIILNQDVNNAPEYISWPPAHSKPGKVTW